MELGATFRDMSCLLNAMGSFIDCLLISCDLINLSFVLKRLMVEIAIGVRVNFVHKVYPTWLAGIFNMQPLLVLLITKPREWATILQTAAKGKRIKQSEKRASLFELDT